MVNCSYKAGDKIRKGELVVLVNLNNQIAAVTLEKAREIMD